MTSLINFCEKENIPYTCIYYYISSSTGKKTSIFEQNNKKVDAINKMKKEFYKQPIYNLKGSKEARHKYYLNDAERQSMKKCYSLFLKHTDNFFCIDIDDKNIKSLDDFNKISNYQFQNCAWIKGNTKGIHIYVKVDDVPYYSNQIDVFKSWKGDFIKNGNNMWETITKKVNNYNPSTNQSFNFNEIKDLLNDRFFKIEKKEKAMKEAKIPKEFILNESSTKREYNLSDEKLINLLDELPSDYLTNYNYWLVITTICKNLNKKEIWDNWCQKVLLIKDKEVKYNKASNEDTWNSELSQTIDANLLMHILKKPKLEPSNGFDLIKQNVGLSEHPNIKTKTVNHKYVSDCITIDEWNNNKTFIIKSCTGGGKTTATAKLFKKELDANKSLKVLSIMNLRTLGNQHYQSFKKEGIELISYQNKELNIETDNLYVCINSLAKIFNSSTGLEFEFENYIVYIDEINSFIKSLTHNETVDKEIKKIYRILNYIIQRCHKIVVSDATIDDNVFTLINKKFDTYQDSKRDESTTIFIINEFKKYENIKAIRLKSENDFLKMLKEHISLKKYFLYGSDSCANAEMHFNNLLTHGIENGCSKEDFILITKNHSFEIGDASITFKNKFVVFSPSITTGVDFSIEEKQDVFIYQNGNSIDPVGSFQQTTRCRNIDTLYYYSNAEYHEPEYESLLDVENEYLSFMKSNKILDEMCKVDIVKNNEIVDEEIIQSNYFKMFCFYEYQLDIFKTNKLKHYELILLKNGFILEEMGETEKISKNDKEQMQECRQQLVDDLFNDYLEDVEKSKKIYDKFNKNVEVLNVQLTKELIEENEILTDMIKDDNKLVDHLNVIRCLKSDNYISNKINELNDTSFKVKSIDNIYNKIRCIRTLEKQLKLKPFEIISHEQDTKIEINDDLFKLVKKLFRTEKKKPTTIKDFKKLYIMMIKQITYTNIIITDTDGERESKKKTKTITTYNLNLELIQQHIKIDKLSNKNHNNYDTYFIELFELNKKINEKVNDELDDFIDEE